MSQGEVSVLLSSKQVEGPEPHAVDEGEEQAAAGTGSEQVSQSKGVRDAPPGDRSMMWPSKVPCTDARVDGWRVLTRRAWAWRK